MYNNLDYSKRLIKKVSSRLPQCLESFKKCYMSWWDACNVFVKNV